MELNIRRGKFDKLIRQGRNYHIQHYCRCGSSVEIVMPFFYGTAGFVQVRCPKCGRKGKRHHIHELIKSGSRNGTPTTDRSLARGIRETIFEWNYGEPTETEEQYTVKNQTEK